MKKKTLATFLLALCLTAQLNFCGAENNYDEEITLPIGTNFDLEMEEVTRYEYDGNYVKAQTVNGKEQFILQKTGDTIINVVMEDKGQKTELRVLVHIVTEQQFNNPNENQKSEETKAAATDDKKTAQPNKEIQQQYQTAKTSTTKTATTNTPIAQTAAPNTPQAASKPTTTKTPIAQTAAPNTPQAASKPTTTKTPIAQTAAPNTPQVSKPSVSPGPAAAATTTTATVKPEAPKQEVSAPIQQKKEESPKTLPAIQTDQTLTRPTAQPQTANEAIKYRADQYAFDVLDLINAERTKNNLRPLSMARDLQADALIRSRELTQRFSHTRPNNTRFYSLMDNPGITRGENIAAGQATPAAVVKAWMNSSVHRENILNPQFTELGVGYYETQVAEYPCYWVQLFRG